MCSLDAPAQPGKEYLTVTTTQRLVISCAFAAIVAGCTMAGLGIQPNSPASSDKAITAFGLASPAAAGVITEAAHTIAVTVPAGTSLSSLVPTIVDTGSAVSPASGVAEDFSIPVTYTVTAADATTQAYVVTVTEAPSSDKAITAFGFASPAALGVVTEAAHTIAVTVPFGTNLTSLVPTIAVTGSGITPASGAAEDFSSPVTYTVTAADASTQAYVVTVTVAPSPAKAITAFGFASPAAAGVIAEATHTIAVVVPFGTSPAGLAPIIVYTGSAISPASGVAEDFSIPVTYTVTAADASTQAYLVTVTVASAIVTFDSQSATVAANPTSITVTAPATTVVTLPTPPTRAGYFFNGWRTAIGGGGSVFTGSTPVTGDITVYAYWTVS
jgi:uncharacterized repeat protein (TIGR02543 family)